MKLDRNSEGAQQRSDFPVLQPGEYDFELENATRKKSSKGKDMWELQLRFEQPNGPDVKVWDYITEQENMQWKFLQLFDCLGVQIEDTEKLKDAIGETGKAKVSIDKGDGQHKERNRVEKYIAKDGNELPF